MQNKILDRFKVKKKIRINSLEAAICNVALFKNMKDKQFRDTIFISYCEQGVILQSVSQQQWKKAHDYIQHFLLNKKIQLLIDGFDKDAYQALINKGLKQITRKIRQSDEECPYINIIHYQKLRKSCQFMDKQHYVQPLKDWEKKNKKNPNFAFLIVEPKSRFNQIKRNLLQYLLDQQVCIERTVIQPIILVYLIFYSPIKQSIRLNLNRKQIQVYSESQNVNSQQDQQYQTQQLNLNRNKTAYQGSMNDEKQGIIKKKSMSSLDLEYLQQEDKPTVIKAINFTNIDLAEYSYSIIESSSKITKSGISLQVIACQQLKKEIKNIKLYANSKDTLTQIIEASIQLLQQKHGQNFGFVFYKRQDQQKICSIIQKYTNAKFSKQEIKKKIQNFQVFSYDSIQFIGQLKFHQNAVRMQVKPKYRRWKACINNCPFLIHEYTVNSIDIDTFIIYLDQLQNFNCSYLCRFHGLVIKNSNGMEIKNQIQASSSQISYLLLFDYHSNTVQNLIQNSMVLDNMQIATLTLQMLYLVNYLHSSQQPRCLGHLNVNQIYQPLCIVLPYLGQFDEIDTIRQHRSDGAISNSLFSIENDIKQIGSIMKDLLEKQKYQQQQIEQLQQIIKIMTNPTKNEQATVKNCISMLQDILCL